MIGYKGFHLSRVGFIILLLTFSWCVEPYDFRIVNNDPTLAIESYISNKSYIESLEFPSDGRYFEVNLKWTSDVINIHDEVESNAKVVLINSLNEEWAYEEMPTGSGRYILFKDDFKALRSIKYKLEISLSNGDQYESSWEALPESHPREMGKISFKEIVKQEYVYKADEKVIDDFDGIDLYVDLPSNTNSSPVFYKWSFTPTWIHIATFTRPSQPIHKCWITNKNYLSNYVLQKDNSGGYPQKQIFIGTTGNSRVYKKFSLLVSQFSMSEGYFLFWKELQEQTKSGGLFDAPPFNLQTNFKAINATKPVSGYFGVVEEQEKRWYFSIDDLSYNIYDNVDDLCNIFYGPDGPGGPECYNCLDYASGNSTNQKPIWWED